MIRSFFLVWALLFAYGGADEWKLSSTVSLKKDQMESILVKSGALEHLFEFRWTLHTNGILVILRSYDDFVAQHTLTAEYKNRSFRVELLPRGLDYKSVPYLLVTFKSFDFKTNEALFEIYLSDDDEKVLLQYFRENN